MSPSVFPLIVETGMGVDLTGDDPTKAALRAVEDTIRRVLFPRMRDLLPGGDLQRFEAVHSPRPDPRSAVGERCAQHQRAAQQQPGLTGPGVARHHHRNPGDAGENAKQLGRFQTLID